MRVHHTRRLRLSRPLDLRLTLWPMRRGLPDPTMRLGDAVAERASRTPTGPATLRLTVRGDSLDAEAIGPGAGWALETLPDLVGESDDVAGFRPAHPLVRELHRRHAGLRITRSRGVFDALVPTVLEQLIVGADARRNYARLVRRLGEPAPGEAGLLLPPSPERLVGTPYWTFHECGIERRRAAVLVSCATRSARIEETAAMAPAAARQRLEALPGVGPWTAAEVAIVALGDADAVSVGDYHMPSVVCWALAGQPQGDDRRMLELLEPYVGQRGRVVRLLMSAGVGPPRRGPRTPRRDIAQI